MALLLVILTLLFADTFCQNVTLPPQVTGTPIQITNMTTASDTIENRDIERPCEIFDIYCIRQYFADHSHCKKMYGPVPDPLYRPKSTGYFPRVNLSITFVDKKYTNFKTKIQEFYINKKTDKLVFAVEFRNITGSSNNTYYRYYRRAREPVTTVDYFTATFASFVTSIVIPNLKHLQLEKGEVFTYVNDATPRFVIGPNAYISPDPSSTGAMARIYLDVPTNIQEYFLTEGSFFVANYIQYNICDFGLNVP